MTKTIKTFKNDNKEAVINLYKEVLDIHFYENGILKGTIEYPDKSYHYVQDAAENWVDGIFTQETLEKYKKTG